MPPADPDHTVAGATGFSLSAASAIARLGANRRRNSPPAPARQRNLRHRLGHAIESVWGRTAIAALAVFVLVLATAVPAFALIQNTPGESDNPLLSSSDVTGSGATRVAGLGVATFIGDIPFVAQQRYLTAAAGGGPAGKLFVDGARQSSIAEYVQDIGFNLTLPYLEGAVETKASIERWTSAVAAQTAPSLSYTAPGAVWQAAPSPPGTALPSTVTFYSCLGSGFCGNMAAGPIVFPGAAACSYDLPFGTRFVISNDPAGRVFTCLDRGILSPTWVDIWFYDPAEGWAFQSVVGTRSSIIILN